MGALNIAIVGSGPSGMYAARKILEKFPNVTLAIFEKQKMPFGLLRSGVSADHPELKITCQGLRRIIRDDRVFYFGNLTFPGDLHVAKYFHAVVDATGGSRSNRVDVFDYNAPNVFDSQQFIEWTLGLNCNRKLEQSIFGCKDISVVGLGNVALDTARFLLSSPNNYDLSYTGKSALRYLALNTTKNVRVFGRRDHTNTAFGIKELRETFERVARNADINLYDFEPANSDTQKLTNLLRAYSCKHIGKQKHRTLGLFFSHSPLRSFYTKDGKCSSFDVLTKNGTQTIFSDLVITCTGCIKSEDLFIKEVPVVKVGWAKNNCKGTLADSLRDSGECIKFIAKVEFNKSVEPISKISFSNEKILNKHDLENMWLYDDAVKLMGRCIPNDSIAYLGKSF